MYMQLYNAAGEWIGQFSTLNSLKAYAAEQGLDMNECEIRMEPNKYPSS
jgi:hypothetical protein